MRYTNVSMETLYFSQVLNKHSIENNGLNWAKASAIYFIGAYYWVFNGDHMIEENMPLSG